MESEVGGGRPKMPLWVKVFIGLGIAVLLLIVGVLAFGGGEHGPGRHFGGGDDSGPGSGNHTAPTQHSGTHAPDAAAEGIPMVLRGHAA